MKNLTLLILVDGESSDLRGFGAGQQFEGKPTQGSEKL